MLRSAASAAEFTPEVYFPIQGGGEPDVGALLSQINGDLLRIAPEDEG